MYVLMSLNEYMTHRYFQHLEFNRPESLPWLKSAPNVGRRGRCRLKAGHRLGPGGAMGRLGALPAAVGPVLGELRGLHLQRLRDDLLVPGQAQAPDRDL